MLPESLPIVSCLCPTFFRPRLLANAIACFLGQDYPADRRELIILDDAGQLQNQTGEGWQLVSIHRRFLSLPEKFNAIAGLAQGKILVVWEDDDIYLPHHISSHVSAIGGHLWSKPSKVLSLYTGELQEEDASGRFHASISMTRKAFEQVGGWPLTLQGDFDQQLMARLSSVGTAADPCLDSEPAYVFRWGSTGAYHGQALMKSGLDQEWYSRVPAMEVATNPIISPSFDAESVATIVKRSSVKPTVLPPGLWKNSSAESNPPNPDDIGL